MAYRAGVVGASGYTGAELLRLLAGHPEIDAVHVTADSNAGLTVGALFPSLAPAYGGLELVKFDPADLAGLDVVFLALPHGESQRVAAAVVAQVPHVVDIGADFRLPADTYEQWYGEPHGAPELLDAFTFGLVELYRPQVAAAADVANPGCYPTAVSLALAPLLAGGLIEPVGIVADACSGVSGAGRALKPASLFSEVNEDVSAYGLLTHRHTAEMEQALAHVYGDRVSVLFTPHLVPMTRGIFATCYARPSGSGQTSAGLLEHYRDFYRGEPFISVVDESPHTKATAGSNSVHVSVRFDARTGTVVALAAEDNLVKGASGQAIQNANLLLGLPETLGLATVGMFPVSVTAASGFVAGGGAIGIKDGNRPDLALVATADRAAVPAAAVFTTNLASAAPVQVSREHLVDGRAGAIVISSGNANAATGEPGRRDARRMCALAGDALGIAPNDVLVCSTGLIGIPLRMEPIEIGIPLVAERVTGDRDGATAAATAMLTTDTVSKEAVASFTTGSATVIVGGMAKGAAMLSPAMATMLAVLTTDARVEPAVLRRALADAVRLSFDRLCVDGCRSTNDTVAVLASGNAGGTTIDERSRHDARALTDALGEVCASLAEQMARDAEGATKFVRIVVTGARSDDDAHVAARAIAASQLVQCSLYGADPYWGRVISEIGASGAHCDPEQIDIDYGGVTVCRDGIACDHDAGALASVMTATDLTVHSELHLGHGEATVLTTDLSPAYIAENMRTS